MATTIYSDWCTAWTPQGATYARKFRIWVTYTLSQATGVYTQAKFTNISFGVELNLSNGGTFNSGVILKINNTQIFKTTTTTKTVYTSSNPTLKFTLGSGGSLNVNRTDSLTSIPITVSTVTYVSEGNHTVSLSKNASVNKLFTLTYYVNGGSAGSISNGTKQYKSSEANITLKTTGAFTRTNYTLKSWNTNSGGTGTTFNLGASYSTQSSNNLYAQWQLNYVKPTISITSIKRYDSNGNEDTEGNKAKIVCKYTRGYYAGASSHNSSIVTHINIKIGSTTAADFNVTNGTEISQQTYTSELLSGTYDNGTTYTVTATITETPSSAYGTQTGTAITTLSATIYPIVINKTTDVTFGIPVIFQDTAESKKNFWVKNPNAGTATSSGINNINYAIAMHISAAGNRGLYEYASNSISTGNWILYKSGSDNKIYIPHDTKISGRVDMDGLFYYSKSNSVLWTGTYYLNSSQTITLSGEKALSAQTIGWVLAWSRYVVDEQKAYNDTWNYTFVPKWHASAHSGNGIAVNLRTGTTTTSVETSKYFYVTDTTITGHANNAIAGTGYDNRKQVLRAVIGV